MDSSGGKAANSGLVGGGVQFQSGTFWGLMFLHHVNNIEHNIKQNLYTDMEIISLIPL